MRGRANDSIKHLPQSPFTGQFFQITTFGIVSMINPSKINPNNRAIPCWQINSIGELSHVEKSTEPLVFLLPIDPLCHDFAIKLNM
jgi:hypothetical protein